MYITCCVSVRPDCLVGNPRGKRADRWSRFRGGDGRGGFSVIELVVGMALTLVVVAGLTSFETSQISALRNQSEQIDLQSSARGVVELLSRDLRRAGMDPSCSGAVEGITDATKHAVQVRADLDGSGAIDQAGEAVSYRYNGQAQRVERSTGNLGFSTLVDGVDVSGSEFRYFDGQGNELVPLPSLTRKERDSVRRVRLELSLHAVRSDVGNGVSRGANLTADVTLRNRAIVGVAGCS